MYDEHFIVDAMKAGELLDLTLMHESQQGVRADFLRRVCRNADKLEIDPHGIWIRGGRIRGVFDLRNIVVAVPIQFEGTVFEAEPCLDYSEIPALALNGCELPGLSARRVRIQHDLSVQESIVCGRIDLSGARTGSVNCCGTVVTGTDGLAVLLEDADVEGGVMLAQRGPGKPSFRASGEVRMRHTRIAGALSFRGATLVNAGGSALLLDGVDAGAGIFLDQPAGHEPFRATGAVTMMHAKIAGELACHGATLDGQGDLALQLDHAEVRGNIFLKRAAAGKRFHAIGQVRMHGTRVSGQLDCDGAALEHEGGYALVLERAQIDELFFRDVRVKGGLNLVHARVASLVDDVRSQTSGSWSKASKLALDNFVYERLVEVPGTKARDRWCWLRGTDGFSPSSWWHLASVYRDEGRDADATATLIAMHKDRLDRGHLSPLRWAGRWMLGVTVGHGYRTWYALVWAALVVAAFATVVWRAPEHFVPAKAGIEGHPQPLLYALDIFLPVVDFVGSSWRTTGWATWMTFSVVLLGWALTTLFVAGFTRVVRT